MCENKKKERGKTNNASIFVICIKQTFSIFENKIISFHNSQRNKTAVALMSTLKIKTS